MNFDSARDTYIQCLEDEVQRLSDSLRMERSASLKKVNGAEKKLESVKENLISSETEVKKLKASIDAIKRIEIVNRESSENYTESFLASYNRLLIKDLEAVLSSKLGLLKKKLVRKIVAEGAELISSGYFNAHWYMNNYHDSVKGDNPLAHYIENEYTLRFNPSKSFDVALYAKKYPDVTNSHSGILLHYLRYGKKENRAVFSVEGKSVVNK